MKISNAINRLEKKGYEIEIKEYKLVAKKLGYSDIHIIPNGNNEEVSEYCIGTSFPTSLKRALELSDELGNPKLRE